MARRNEQGEDVGTRNAAGHREEPTTTKVFKLADTNLSRRHGNSVVSGRLRMHRKVTRKPLRANCWGHWTMMTCALRRCVSDCLAENGLMTHVSYLIWCRR